MNNMENYTLPKINNLKKADIATANRMISALWNRFTLNQGATSLTYWMEQFSSEKSANKVIIALADEGVIETVIKHNYAELLLSKDYVEQTYSPASIARMIKNAKVRKYMPQFAEEAVTRPQFDQTKLTSGVQETGLARFGFAEAGQKHSFKYDVEMMAKYKTEIINLRFKILF